MSLPLVTLVVFGYNQENFIREAIEGAFSQTYSPLEIILSDDCSADGTFQTMQAMAASYRGNHTIRLNRILKNRGFAAHVNSVMALAAGELVVFAAGDDCSLPQRVERLTSEWIRFGKPSGIASWVTNIDENGRPLEPLAWVAEYSDFMESASRDQLMQDCLGPKKITVPGCSAAWSMNTWNKFGNLKESLVNEDNVLSFRAILDQGLRIIREPLVLYRRHTNNVWNKDVPGKTATPGYYEMIEEANAKRANCLWKVQESSLSDLKIAVSLHLVDAEKAKTLEASAMEEMRRLEAQARWWGLPSLKRVWLIAHSPHRNFPLNLTSVLPLNRHAQMRTLFSKTRRTILSQTERPG